MAPILIDSRDQLKLGFISILVTVLAFAGGFFMGQQRAATFYQAGSEVQPLPLPEQVATAKNVVDPRIPSEMAAGEDIDVDQPEGNMLPGNTSTASAQDKLELVSSAKASTLNDDKTSTSPDVEVNEQNYTEKNQVAKSPGTGVVRAFTSDELSKIKYSVQVGMYGRLVNAENMVNVLRERQYDAYVSDYTNRKNEIRYNVRFGYFTDKKSAVEMLGKFKTSQNADGYLVKFSVDNIVNIANATSIEQVSNNSAHEAETDNVSTPVTNLPSAAEDKISQADVLNDARVITN
jgi:cell division septation protein DedD